MTLNISSLWEKEKYFSFLQDVLETGSTFKIVTALKWLGKRPVDESNDLIEVLYNYFSMEHPKEIRFELIETMNNNSDVKWWDEERTKLLRNWIANESDDAVIKEVRRLFRWIMQENSNGK